MWWQIICGEVWRESNNILLPTDAATQLSDWDKTGSNLLPIFVSIASVSQTEHPLRLCSSMMSLSADALCFDPAANILQVVGISGCKEMCYIYTYVFISSTSWVFLKLLGKRQLSVLFTQSLISVEWFPFIHFVQLSLLWNSLCCDARIRVRKMQLHLTITGSWQWNRPAWLNMIIKRGSGPYVVTLLDGTWNLHLSSMWQGLLLIMNTKKMCCDDIWLWCMQKCTHHS